MQRKTLYIHLGTHRTATSSIQEYLHSNFDALVAQGVLYPLGVRRHVHLVNNLFSGRRNPLELAHDLLQRAESKPTAIHSIILSDEDIAMRRNLSIFAQMQEVFDVKFVYCLRRQDIWLESWYMQNVKWQWDKTLAHITFPEFCNRISDFDWIDYDNYLSHLESLVGKENVITYVFERRDMPRGPVQAFADLVGIDSRNLPPPPHSNASFSPLLVEFSRRLPMEKAPPALRKKIEAAIFEADRGIKKNAAEASKLLLSHDQRAAILAQFEPGNAEVAKRYFNRTHLFRDDVPNRDEPIAELKLPEDSDALMQRLVTPFVEALIKQLTIA